MRVQQNLELRKVDAFLFKHNLLFLTLLRSRKWRTSTFYFGSALNNVEHARKQNHVPNPYYLETKGRGKKEKENWIN